MSSDSLGLSPSSALLPRRRREPRKLNYDKCTFCRQAKVKCAPERRSWPEQKCGRCAEKKFVCSAPQRKGPAPESFKQGSQALPAPPSETSEKESVSPSGTKDALLLLGLHSILRLVIEEVRALAEEFLSPFKHDLAWKVHLREAGSVFGHYDKILQTVSNQLMGLPEIEARAVIKATLDITSCSLATVQFKRIDANILKYEKEDHFGIAYVLLMQQMMRQPSLPDSNISSLLRFQARFFEDCLKFCQSLDIAHMEDFRSVMSVAQSYIPKDILSVPPEKQRSFLLQWNAGDEDCLGRSLSHLTHDRTAPADAYPPWQNTAYMHADILGRIPVHLACLRADHKLFQQVDPKTTMLNAKCLGLRAMEIAAIKGDVQIMHHIVFFGGYFSYPGKQEGPMMRNCLHWAASCGHLEAVKELCSWRNRFLTDIINMRDYLGDTPIHLAARFGHAKIVQHLLGLVDWNIIDDPYHSRSPFFSAVTGGYTLIMKMLHPHSNIDKFDDFTSSEDGSARRGGRCYRLTPLAEAARQGFTAGVQYLLKCNETTPGTVNPNSINKYVDEPTEGYIHRQTPLDFAIDGQHTDCIAILKRNGARTCAELPLVMMT